MVFINQEVDLFQLLASWSKILVELRVLIQFKVINHKEQKHLIFEQISETVSVLFFLNDHLSPFNFMTYALAPLERFLAISFNCASDFEWAK